MTLELRTQVRRLADDGYGWEDICVRLGIRCERGRQMVRQTVFHVKHRQLESEAAAVS